jgi:FAD/FMN-containing dehydrogenase
MTNSWSISRSHFQDLAARLTGELVLPEHASYEPARQLWNGLVHARPAAIVRCANTQDVMHTVRWARSRGLALSVRGGGHDCAGRALCEEGIVIDCSPMREITLDLAARTARAASGATAGDLIDAAQPYGLATPTGTISTVGLAGLTLGGGYGHLQGKYGLVADNLVAAEVVTADGDLVTASTTEHADLFWGLRGGGGNWGVVVSFTYRLHSLPQVVAGQLIYALEQAPAVLRAFSEFIQMAPDEVTIQLGFIQLPDGQPALYLWPVYCGASAEGERVLAPLRIIGKPFDDQIKPIAYSTLITTVNAYVPKGRNYFIQTQSLDGLRAEAMEALLAAAQAFSSPFSAISVHHFHGAASRMPASSTAFALRRDHLMVEILAGWEPSSPEADQVHMQWARDTSRALAPYALPGGYISLLDEGDWERVPLAFGSNYERLRGLKRTYDPDDVFHSTIGHISP